MTLVVNLFAGPGVGKSTTAALVFGKLKDAGDGHPAIVLPSPRFVGPPVDFHGTPVCPDPECHRTVTPGASYCPSGHRLAFEGETTECACKKCTETVRTDAYTWLYCDKCYVNLDGVCEK